VQCHDPVTVERIRKLKGAKLVAYGVNVFLRTYELPHPLAWVEALLSKPQNPPPNDPFSGLAGHGRVRASETVSEQPALA
jgi:hypothetical protein